MGYSNSRAGAVVLVGPQMRASRNHYAKKVLQRRTQTSFPRESVKTCANTVC